MRLEVGRKYKAIELCEKDGDSGPISLDEIPYYLSIGCQIFEVDNDKEILLGILSPKILLLLMIEFINVTFQGYVDKECFNYFFDYINNYKDNQDFNEHLHNSILEKVSKEELVLDIDHSRDILFRNSLNLFRCIEESNDYLFYECFDHGLIELYCLGKEMPKNNYNFGNGKNDITQYEIFGKVVIDFFKRSNEHLFML